MHYQPAKAILSAQNGINLFRGCTHGCIYCDARSLCYGMEHDFEDVAIKINAPELLEEALSRKRQPCMIGTGAMCDPYLPLEREEGLTRRCLEIILRHGCGLAIQTKSDLILRDLELLTQINQRAKCVAQLTLTTWDEDLCRLVEPRVCTTARRAEVLRCLGQAGVPTVVWLSPLLPYINDTTENLRGILSYCAEAGVWGVLCFGMGLTLRAGNREYFYQQLDRHFPGLKQKYQRRYGLSYQCNSDNHRQLWRLFEELCQRYGLVSDPNRIFAYLRQFPRPERGEQLSLF